MAISKLILNGEVQMDVTSDTVTAGSMLSGTTATKNDGTKTTGTISTKSAADLTVSGSTVTVPAGYYSSQASAAIPLMSDGYSISFDFKSSTAIYTITAQALGSGYIQSGELGRVVNGLTTLSAKTYTPTESTQYIQSYRWLTGSQTIAAISSTYVGTGVSTRSSANLTASGSTVTAPAGYYSTAATKSISAGSAFPPAVTITKNPTIGVNTSGVVTASYTGSSSITPTVTAGYISQGTAGTISTTGVSTYQLTSKAAATYNTSTADQTIASQRWLVGAQTIKSVTTSNLTADNIKSGVTIKVGDANNASRIAQVTGTYEPVPESNTFEITLTQDSNENWIPDCTYAEAVAAYNNGKTLTFTAGYPAAYASFDNYDEFGGTIAYFVVEYFLIGFNDNGLNKKDYIWYYNDDIDLDLSDIYHSTSNANAQPSDVVQDKVFYNADGYQVGTAVSSPYYDAYKTIALKSQVQRSATSYSRIFESFINQLSSVPSFMFQNIKMVGDFIFPACVSIFEYGFGHNSYNTCGMCTFAFPELTYIGNRAFQYQSTLSSFSAPKVTTIGNSAFAVCTSLKTADFPSCTYINTSAFYNCNSLASVNFPVCTYIGTSAFFNCSALTTVSFPVCTYIGTSAFYNCSALTTVSFPSCSAIGNSAFYNCSALSTVSFPACTSIGLGVFYNCRSLASVSFPVCTSIGASAFYNCSALTTVSFPVCTIVSSSAFTRCISLTTIRLPACTSIASWTFNNCFNLLSVYLMGSSVASLINVNAFLSTPISTYTTSTGGVHGSIFVPASLYNSYITALNWSVYSARIVSV